VQTILIATDADHVFAELEAALGSSSTQLLRVTEGRAVRAAVKSASPDIVILDLQIGSMGGVAVSIDLRLESGAGRIPETGILLLLDRAADTFVADMSGADGWITKPLDARRIERAVATVARGESYFEEPALRS
jgi:DNA-binding response OmpR family regulator